MKKQKRLSTDHPHCGSCGEDTEKDSSRPDNLVLYEKKQESCSIDEKGESSQNNGKEFRERIIRLAMIRPGLGLLPKSDFLSLGL
jgi:hypothetical protein